MRSVTNKIKKNHTFSGSAESARPENAEPENAGTPKNVANVLS